MIRFEFFSVSPNFFKLFFLNSNNVTQTNFPEKNSNPFWNVPPLHFCPWRWTARSRWGFHWCRVHCLHATRIRKAASLETSISPRWKRQFLERLGEIRKAEKWERNQIWKVENLFQFNNVRELNFLQEICKKTSRWNGKKN